MKIDKNTEKRDVVTMGFVVTIVVFFIFWFTCMNINVFADWSGFIHWFLVYVAFRISKEWLHNNMSTEKIPIFSAEAAKDFWSIFKDISFSCFKFVKNI